MLPVEDLPVFDFLVAGHYQSFNRKPIHLTQRDVRELQLAKAAGVMVLMQRMGISVEDIDTIYLAGKLGNYINPYSAMRIGLIPITAPEKIVSPGNASSAGARMALLSKGHWRESAQIAGRIEHVELSVQPDFLPHFIIATDFPADNLW